MNDYGSRGASERGSIEARRGRQNFGGLFDFEPLRSFFPGNWQQVLGMEVTRREDGYEIEMAVPGFRPDDLEINYQDGVMTVNGHNEKRNFTRSFTVPDDIDEENIQATVENGMLIVRLRQHPKRQPRKIAVQGVTGGPQQVSQQGSGQAAGSSSGTTTTGATGGVPEGTTSGLGPS